MGIFLQEVGRCIFSLGQWCFLAPWTEMYCNEFNCRTWESGSMCCVFLHTDSVSKSLCVVFLKTETLMLVLNCFIAAVDHKILEKKAHSDHIANNLENKTCSCHSTTELLLDMTHIFFPISRCCLCLPTDKQACPDPSWRACVTTHWFHFNTLRCRNYYYFFTFPMKPGFHGTTNCIKAMPFWWSFTRHTEHRTWTS